MGSSHYSFIDIVVLDEIRGRFADGDALVVLSTDLGKVLWANGPGARLFGYGDIGGIIGAAPKMGLPAERQIASTSGFPDVGRDRPIAVRVTNGFTSRAVNLLASGITMPDGERAILLASPTGNEPSTDAAGKAERAIQGFGEEGQFTALVDGEGKIVAASPDFVSLAIGEATLLGLIGEAQGPERLVKKRIPVRALLMPAGLARLTDEPAIHLIVVVDDGEAAALPAIEEAASTPEAVAPLKPRSESSPIEPPPIGTPYIELAGGDGDVAAKPVPPADDSPHSPVDRWYFLQDEEKKPAPGAAPTTEQDNEPSAKEARPAPGLRKAELGTTPVRFVWRTDADGRFTSISEEFAAALGDASADISGHTFREIAQAFGFDADGEIAGLLERRDTWSGRSVLWPAAGTDMRVPVDLAALPVYGRDRDFQGFRGFGVARVGDAVALPAPEQPAPRSEAAVSGGGDGPPAPGTVEGDPAPSTAEEPASKSADPFEGEVPALAIVPKPERRYSDKIIRLAEHRPAANEDGLSRTERNAFREIGARLKKDSAKRGEAEGSQTPGEIPAGGTDADKVLPVVRETFGKRDWLKISASQAATPEADAGNPARPAEENPARPAGENIASGDVEADGAAEDTGDTGDTGAPGEIPSGATPTEATDPVEAGDPTVTVTEDAPVTLDTGQNTMADAAPVDAGSPIAADTGEAKAVSEPAGEVSKDEAGAAETYASTPEVEPADEHEPAIPSAFVSPAFVSSAFVGERQVPSQPDLYAAILSKLPTPVLVHSGDELHYANDEFLRLTGYPSLQAIRAAGGLGELFADPYDAEDDTEGRKICLRTASGETTPVKALLQSVPWKGGKVLMLALTPVARAPEREGLAEIRQLPSPHEDAEPTALPETKADPDVRLEELRTIIDTATDGVVLISPEGTIRSISRPAEALFGFDSDEVAGKPFAALFAIESQRAAQDYLQGLSDNGVASVLNDGREVIGREAQGRFIPLFMTIGRLPGDNGFCAVLRDVTHWKRAEEELTQARSQAEQASSQKTAFLARVSHEIRTPLNAIIGFSELMIDEKFGPIGNDRYRDYLRDINRSGNHVLDLVNDLLDISKIEAGEQEMNYEAVSLNDTLTETVAMMQPQANRERVIIRSSFPSRLPEVVADLRSVRQIALNLLSNAIRYTQAGGQVIVSTSYETSGDIVMRVRDTGIGMSPAEIEQAMKPFKQVNTLRRPRGDGTGLGLPLTKAMVEANRARFSINSTPGEGTLVEVTFPSTRVLAD